VAFVSVAIPAVTTAVASGGIQAVGAVEAARTQAKAGEAAVGEQQREFDITQQNLAPYRAAGQQALTQLTAMTTPGYQFDKSLDPGYEFRKSEGTSAIESSAAAKGLQLSGMTLKDLVRFGQDYASGEFQNTFNRQSTIAGFGANATNVQAQTGASTAASIGNTITGIGNANAAGIVGATNAIGGAAQNVGNTLLLKSVLGGNNTNLSSPSTNIGIGEGPG
jgi:hypothetical protein